MTACVKPTTAAYILGFTSFCEFVKYVFWLVPRRGVVASVVRHITKLPYVGPAVSTGMGYRIGAGMPSRYVTSQLDQLSLASRRGRKIEYQLRLG